MGKEYIIEVNDCAMGLLGDGQDEDTRLIAEIVINSMEEKCKVPAAPEKPAIPPSEATSSRPESSQSIRDTKSEIDAPDVTEKEEKDSKKKEKTKKEHKRDRSEEKAKKAEKEAKRAEKREREL